jgi:hypothetical protein
MSESRQEFNYMMLSRLKMDCEYFLNYGRGHVKHLWAQSVEEQIKEMIKLYDQLKIKPEWLTIEQIKEYETKMLNYKCEA